ncbi:hypothetical protein ACFLUE_01610 [Chloroflexota bacterium]
MVVKMVRFLQRMQKAKLYKQWVEKTGLSPEDIPADLQESKGEEVDREGSNDDKRLQYRDSVLIRLRIKYIFLMGFIIATLLVALSVVSTILIMQLR